MRPGVGGWADPYQGEERRRTFQVQCSAAGISTRNARRSDAEAGPRLGGALKAQVALKGRGPRNDSSVSGASGSQP